jgi:hypothetical protein
MPLRTRPNGVGRRSTTVRMCACVVTLHQPRRLCHMHECNIERTPLAPHTHTLRNTHHITLLSMRFTPMRLSSSTQYLRGEIRTHRQQAQSTYSYIPAGPLPTTTALVLIFRFTVDSCKHNALFVSTPNAQTQAISSGHLCLLVIIKTSVLNGAILDVEQHSVFSTNKGRPL